MSDRSTTAGAPPSAPDGTPLSPEQSAVLELIASTRDHVFVTGRAGTGKSTLAAFLARRGGVVVADDLCVFDPTWPQPMVRATFPRLKLWCDSLAALDVDPAGLVRVVGDRDKYLRLILESRVMAWLSRDESPDQGTEQTSAPFAGIMDELKEPKVDWQLFL